MRGLGAFVGREREWELLHVRLRAAFDGEGQVVLVAGEPGVGKTRLAEEASHVARGLGLLCGWGRATHEEGCPPYWPFRQVVRELRKSGRIPADLALLGPGRGDRVEYSGAGARFGLFEALTDALVATAEPNGLLVVLDDLQWADLASVQLLVHMAMGVARSRMIVLATYRTPRPRGRNRCGPPWQRWPVSRR